MLYYYSLSMSTLRFMSVWMISVTTVSLLMWITMVRITVGIVRGIRIGMMMIFGIIRVLCLSKSIAVGLGLREANCGIDGSIALSVYSIFWTLVYYSISECPINYKVSSL